jgi:AraC-like DNA-binding protein
MPDKNILVNALHYKKETDGPIMPIHWHNCLELICVQDGELAMWCSDKRIKVSKGSIIIVNHNEYHGFECSSAPLDLYCILLDLSVLKGRFFDSCEEKYIQPIIQNQVIFNNVLEDNSQIAFFIQSISEEFFNKHNGYELAIKAYLYNLLVILFRNNTGRIMTPNESKTRNRNYNKMNKVLDYINQNYMEEITVDELADMIGVTKYYFCKLFKKLNGKTLSEYINYIRISEAYLLIKGTDLRITDIAMTVGFTDINYFSRVFKSIMSISPTMVRKDIKSLNYDK